MTALNKIDALEEEEIAERRAALEAELGHPVMLMSGVARTGVTDVLRALWTRSSPRAPRRPETPEGTWQP